jgi:hypothetical protein
MREVRFPDVDHDSLAALTDELNAAQFELECVEAALASARDVLRERARALNAHAARGLSYARIYAAENRALAGRIAEIELLVGSEAQPSAAAPGKKRGRPRKESAAGTDMFADARESAEEEAAA